MFVFSVPAPGLSHFQVLEVATGQTGMDSMMMGIGPTCGSKEPVETETGRRIWTD